MRRFLSFDCADDRLAATLDDAPGTTGLLIVSGGNEIRAGSHANQARLAAWCADQGHPCLRYDRPGTGDSEGVNRGYLQGGDPLKAALAAFRAACPGLTEIVAFGNCDAASLLIHSGAELGADALMLANPWLIEPADENAPDSSVPVLPSSAAIRARYLARLRNPVRLLKDLLGGGIDLRKLAAGLARLRQTETPSPLALRAATSLETLAVPTTILIARGDATAMTFIAAWRSKAFGKARANRQVTIEEHRTSSHSFSDDAAQVWLREHLLECLSRHR